MLVPRHGCRVVAALLAPIALHANGSSPTPASQLSSVSSHAIDLNYACRGSESLVRVDLWYTVDGGQSWHLAGIDPDLQPPIRFRAQSEGLHGFFFVLSNEFGASSLPPAPGQGAHHWVLFDSSAPLAQIKHVHVVPGESGPSLSIGWAVHDDNLAERPIELFYQLAEQPGWQLIAEDVSNAGRFEWPLPDSMQGSLQVKLVATDRAGNVSEDASGPLVLASAAPPAPAAPQGLVPSPPPFETRSITPVSTVGGFDIESDAAPQSAPVIPPPIPLPSTPAARLAAAPTIGSSSQEAWPTTIDSADMQRALELYELGVFHKERGDYALATERLVEAMNVDPEMTAPAYELAEIYYADGKYQQAIGIYETILNRHQDDREALRGTALALVALRNYPDALRRLDRVLEIQPEDAQTWLDAGDLFIWMGQRRNAVDYWRRALDLSERRSPVWSKAQLKLKKFALDNQAASGS